MKKIKKIIVLLFSMLFALNICNNNVFAGEVEYYSPYIPVELKNVEEIEFIDDTHFIVIKGVLNKEDDFKYMDMSDNSLKYDNIACGTKVTVTAKNIKTGKEVSHSMTKWDAGGLHDAIIDIYYDGVTYWGGTTKNYKNFAIKNTVIKHKKVYKK